MTKSVHVKVCERESECASKSAQVQVWNAELRSNQGTRYKVQGTIKVQGARYKVQSRCKCQSGIPIRVASSDKKGNGQRLF